MDCAGCASKIDTAVRKLPGVEEVSVSVSAGTLKVRHGDDVDGDRIMRQVRNLGYGAEPARLVEGLLSVGAVGFNIEDTVHGEGGRLRSAQEHADLVAALRAESDGAGVHLVINARTDVFIKQTGPAESRVDLAVERLTLAAQAGADVLYPVGGHDAATWARLAEALPLPVNAIAFPDKQRLADFAPLGVARISFGPRLQGALGTYAGELFTAWK